ncbi:MAG: hypothetical protein JW814_08160 [Candidatus Krumholzibacteriota bacterium]|nr:hypothetical protein [Candidatus Krumholzibacteriota bacterium]
MLISRQCISRISAVLLLLIAFTASPASSGVREISLFKEEVIPVIAYQYEFGEPGHDPFSRGGPTGNTWRKENFNHEETELEIPDINGNGSNGSGGVNSMIDLIESCCRGLIGSFRSF